LEEFGKRLSRYHARIGTIYCPIKTEVIFPLNVQIILTKALIDALGCGLHGSTTSSGLMMRDFVLEQGGTPESGVWVLSEKSAHGMRSCIVLLLYIVLIFGDHSRAKIHPGAVVIPTALALAEKYQASGQTIMKAIAAGDLETMNRCQFGQQNLRRARTRGWHLTGTCGTFAAAASSECDDGFRCKDNYKCFGFSRHSVCWSMGFYGRWSYE
jgi:2-methylcitrate dehydratase PrpD